MPCVLWVQVHEGQVQLKEKIAALMTANDQLKLCKMELEGANAHLQVRASLLIRATGLRHRRGMYGIMLCASLGV
jgi:hypothetical protein